MSRDNSEEIVLVNIGLLHLMKFLPEELHNVKLLCILTLKQNTLKVITNFWN